MTDDATPTTTPANTPPVLTDERRAEALQKAIHVRRVLAEFKTELKEGKHPDVLATLVHAANDPILARLKARVFIESLPGVGKVKAKQLMASASIADSRRLGGLGQHQRVELASQLRLFGKRT